MASLAGKDRLIVAAVVACAALTACDVQNNQMIGRVEASIDKHQVVVTNCHTKQLAKVHYSDEGDSWTPCPNAAVVIKDGTLFVNGESYGRLGEDDGVLVEDGTAKIIPK